MAKTQKKIYGDVKSIKRSVLKLLEGLYDCEPDRKRFITEDVAQSMALASAMVNREVAVMIDRRGIVQAVSVGDSGNVDLFSVQSRRLVTRVSGIRCVHTHPNGAAGLSDVDISALKQMRLDAMAVLAVTRAGRIKAASAAICPPNGELKKYGIFHVAANAAADVAANAATDVAANAAADTLNVAVDAASDVAANAAAWAANAAADVAANAAAWAAYGAADAGRASFDRAPAVSQEILEALDSLLPEMLTQDAHAGHDYYDPAGYLRERALLVGVRRQNGDADPLGELEQLAWTAGASVQGKVLYRERETDAAYFIGTGKLEDIRQVCQETKADIVVFNDGLSGVQVRNLEDALGVKVVDRTTLILDIFAGRAHTREGKLQVELAQLNHNLTRLTGRGVRLSRLGGGIGTRGPGEKKLDVDRRHIRRRIHAIEEELHKTRERRDRTRNAGRMSSMPVVAFVGYTNAGKSTLFNALCGADVFTEDKLFATLDPTARKLDLPSGGSLIAVDTVGFIDKLPHELVDAFKATLEESVYADILLHVADMSNPAVQAQIETVEQILHGIGAGGKKTLVAFNKADLMEKAPEWLDFWRSVPYGKDCANTAPQPQPQPSSRVCVISAKTGEGLGALRHALEELAQEEYIRLDVLIPYGEGRVCAYLHENASVLGEEYTDAGVSMKVMLGKGHAGWLRRFMV